MKVPLISPTDNFAGIFTIRCPHCSNSGTFHNILKISDVLEQNNGVHLGIRKCPNPECQGQVFFMKFKNGSLITYPSIRIDFDKDGVPGRVLKTFEEAITCHSNKCYIASAIMIRRTLEEICEDRGALGKNLQERLKKLRETVILPNELFEAANDLRLLGNDAAHIESKNFDEISEREVTISLMLTKEILKSLYQYRGLLDELKILKRENENK